MSFVSLYLLAVLSAAFQHSWSLFSWNLLYLISKSQSIWAFYFTGPPSGLPNLLTLPCTSASPQDLFSLHSPGDSIQVPDFMLGWISNILSPSQIFFHFKFHLSSYDNKNPNLDFVLSLWYSFLISENGNFILSLKPKNFSITFDSYVSLPHSKWQQILLTLLSIYILSLATFHHLQSHLTRAIVISSLDDCNHT